MENTRTIIWIEKVDDRGRGALPGRSEKLIAAMPERFEALGTALSDAADRFWAGLKHTDRPPEIVELELNVGVEAGGDWLILSGKAHASATVKLVWKRADV